MKEFNIEDALSVVGFKVAEYDGVIQAFGLSLDRYGEITMQLHRNFYRKSNSEMCVLANREPHLDELYLGDEPRTYEDFVALMRLLFPDSTVMEKSEKFVAFDVYKRFDDIEKYLMCDGHAYVPIIYKHENPFDSRSVWVMYAKENRQSFSRLKILFAVKAGTLERAVAKFIAKYDELCVDKIIRGREWYGEAPHGVDFWND